MKINLSQLAVSAVVAALPFVLVNCVQIDPTAAVIPGKVTGGGFVQKADGSRANFGFNASSCDGPVSGNFNYHDRTAAGFDGGVKMNGAVIEANQCDEAGGCSLAGAGPGDPKCPYEGYGVTVGYKSTNPKVPGTGTAGACVVDNGEGKNSTGDLLGLAVDSGPYAGYFLSGTVKGNIQAHACK